MKTVSIALWLSAFLMSPLFIGLINRTKAFFAGRRGAPLFQLYYDLGKLFRKGAVFSQTTTWVFRAAPLMGFLSVAAALLVMPFGGREACLAFPADLIVFIYFLGLGRFVTLLGAMDTGSSFEGMGASREAAFSALAEPALLMSLVTLMKMGGADSLSKLTAGLNLWNQPHFLIAGLFLMVALFIVLLAENARLPFDDPNTHLELTMIHEAMVLDHSGPDLALIQYGAALKLWAFSALLLNALFLPPGTDIAGGIVLSLGGMAFVAVLIGAVESSMSRLRLLRVPHLLVASNVFAAIAFLITLL